jgi:ribosomal-protein-alanine N-acetyltransferase
MEIETARLRLVKIPTEVLRRRLELDDFSWNGVSYPPEWPGDAVAIFPVWLANRKKEPEAIEWGGVVIEKRSQTAVGMISAKGTPVDGTVEIGYGFNRSVWGQGFATEITAAFCEWIFCQPGITEITAATRPENVASGRVLVKTGFCRYGEQVEANDGLLHRYRKLMAGFAG